MLKFISMALILLWWVCSLTVLLPVTIGFILSKTLASKWQTFLFGNLGFLFQPPMTPLRKKAFKILKDSLENVEDHLEILEIGVGDGANLPFYPEGSRLTVLDVNAHFESYFRRNSKKWKQVEYKGTIISGAEDMREVKDCSFDVVVGTYVLCSCKDPVEVLKEVKRVLKPGGKYLFLEHIFFQDGGFNSWLQKIAGPLWKLYFNGCVLDRDSGTSIRKTGFSDVKMDPVTISGIFVHPYSPQIIGMAIK
ncbi:hypothetical protein JTE90_012195 [Oedothorax gibbosus]|uniref:Methyltransferase type 11 domain-containing protein n=1 Tax=Oedothorax gibbosus TaxID=931172 RepID=A0AAV6VBY6_9ARAC|nr:hypothetical protein JTE90_012195 [Oedothorax gibbosus]